jgi:hypothetical protein
VLGRLDTWERDSCPWRLGHFVNNFGAEEPDSAGGKNALAAAQKQSPLEGSLGVSRRLRISDVASGCNNSNSNFLPNA